MYISVIKLFFVASEVGTIKVSQMMLTEFKAHVMREKRRSKTKNEDVTQPSAMLNVLCGVVVVLVIRNSHHGRVGTGKTMEDGISNSRSKQSEWYRVIVKW